MTFAPRFPVRSPTSFENEYFRETIGWSQPFWRARAALSSEDTVPITFAPSAFAHWQRNRPTPPAAACTRTVSPGPTRTMRCRRDSAFIPLSQAAPRHLAPREIGPGLGRRISPPVSGAELARIALEHHAGGFHAYGSRRLD